MEPHPSAKIIMLVIDVFTDARHLHLVKDTPESTADVDKEMQELLDEDSEEYQEYLLDIKNNVEVMRLKLKNELEALKNPSRKPMARRARGSAGAPVCSPYQLLFRCCLTLPDAHTALCHCLPAAVD